MTLLQFLVAIFLILLGLTVALVVGLAMMRPRPLWITAPLHPLPQSSVTTERGMLRR